jgi:hypothetical protein
MTDTVIRGGVESTLRARGPAYSVIQKCLSVQDDAQPLGGLARFFGLTPLNPDARSWYQGALGEVEVARSLSKLGPEWTVLHAVPVGAGEADIDHVVIGPNGVFTLNTKNHAGKRIFVGGRTFMVNGVKQHFVRNSEFEATRASRLLSAAVHELIEVTPVIVVVGAESITVGRTAPVVEVRSSGQIGRWLQKRKRVLSYDQVVRIAQAAGQRGTWHTAEAVLDDTQRHVVRFERLRREVDAAAHRARLWATCGTLAGIVALAVIVLNILPTVGAGQ